MSSVNFNGGNISADDIAGVLNAVEGELTAPGLQTGLRTPGQAVTVNVQADASASKAAAEFVAEGLNKSGKSAEAAAGSGAVTGTGKVNSAGAASKASGLESMSAVGAGIDIAASVRSDMASGIPDIARPDILSPFVDSRHDSQRSLESLIEAFNGKTDENSVKNARSAVQAGAAERIKESNERLEEMKTQLDKIQEEKSKSWAQKVFDALKAVVQVIGAAVAVATAVLCPNPLTIAAAVLTVASTIEGLMSTFSDGELSFSNLCSEIDKLCGGDGKIGEMFASVLQTAVGIAASFMGSSGVSQVAKAVQSGVETAKSVANNLAIVKDLREAYDNLSKVVKVATTLGEVALKLADEDFRKALKEDLDQFADDIDDALDLSGLNHNKLLASILSQLGVSEEEIEKIKEALSGGGAVEGSLDGLLDGIKGSLIAGGFAKA